MDVQSILKEEKIMNKEIIHLNYKERYGLTSVQLCEKNYDSVKLCTLPEITCNVMTLTFTTDQ